MRGSRRKENQSLPISISKEDEAIIQTAKAEESDRKKIQQSELERKKR